MEHINHELYRLSASLCMTKRRVGLGRMVGLGGIGHGATINLSEELNFSPEK